MEHKKEWEIRQEINNIESELEISEKMQRQARQREEEYDDALSSRLHKSRRQSDRWVHDSKMLSLYDEHESLLSKIQRKRCDFLDEGMRKWDKYHQSMEAKRETFYDTIRNMQITDEEV